DVADGITPVALSITMEDQFGNPLAGGAVTVTGLPSTTTRIAPLTQSSQVPARTTDMNGVAVFDAYDTTAEPVTYTATDTTDNVVVTQTVSVTFVAGLPQVSESTIGANPTSVPADGTSASTITVTINDHNGNPVPGKTVALTALGGGSTITSVSPVTNSTGVATFTVADTHQEVVTYTAADF